MADDRAELKVDFGDASAQAAKVAASLNDVRIAAQGVGDSYGVLEQRYDDYALIEGDLETVARRKVEYLREMARRTAEAAQQTAQMGEVQREVNQVVAASTGQINTSAGSIARITEFMQEWRREILNLGHAAQDLAQGGFPATLNNISGFFTKMPVAASIATSAATALYVVWDPLVALFKQLMDGANDVPKVTDALQRLSDSLVSYKKELEGLESQSKLTDIELGRHTFLIHAQADAQDRLNEATERQKTLEAQRSGEAKANLDPASGKAVSQVITQEGGVNAVVDRLAKSIQDATPEVEFKQNVLNRAIRDRDAWAKANPDLDEQFNPVSQRVIDEAKKALNAALDATREKAEKTVADALKGDQTARQALQANNGAFAAASPDYLAEKAKADAEGQQLLAQARKQAEDVRAGNEKASQDQTAANVKRVQQDTADQQKQDADQAEALEKLKQEIRDAAGKDAAAAAAEGGPDDLFLRGQRAGAQRRAGIGRDINMLAANAGMQFDPADVEQASRDANLEALRTGDQAAATNHAFARLAQEQLQTMAMLQGQQIQQAQVLNDLAQGFQNLQQRAGPVLRNLDRIGPQLNQGWQ
jgi:hypothetical protein